jgi:hypothetical protein
LLNQLWGKSGARERQCARQHRKKGKTRLIAATGVTAMCDYSLHHVASRPAKVGDKLVSTRFSNSITGGFASIGEPNVAVCLRPGTEVAFEKDVEVEPALGFLPSRKVGQRVARFRQVNMDRPDLHHDALEFPNGQVVLVTRLREGQHATVLQLPAGQRTIEATPEEARTASINPERAFDPIR